MPAPLTVAPAPVAPAPTNGAAPPAAATAEEATFEVTVGGKATKLTRKQLERYAGKGAFADQTIQQAKEALRAAKEQSDQAAERKRRIKEDKSARDEFLREHGIDPDEFSRERLAEKIREAELSPEQKERDAEKRRAEVAEKKLRALEEERAQGRLSQAARVKQQQIESELGAAWDRAGFQVGDSDAFYAVYEVMKEFSELGLLDPRQPFTAALADRIIDTARENIEGTDKRREAAVLKGLKGEALVRRLGKSVVDEVLRFKVEELRGGGAKKTNGVPPPAQRPGEPSQFITPQEAMKKMRGGG